MTETITCRGCPSECVFEVKNAESGVFCREYHSWFSLDEIAELSLRRLNVVGVIMRKESE